MVRLNISSSFFKRFLSTANNLRCIENNSPTSHLVCSYLKPSMPIIFNQKITLFRTAHPFNVNQAITPSNHEYILNHQQRFYHHDTHTSFDKEKGLYISQAAYAMLSTPDKQSLDEVLFTTMGFYALSNNYFTVDDFLSLPLDVRYDLWAFFWYIDGRPADATRCQDKIRRLFNNHHLNLNHFSQLSHDKRQALIKLLNVHTEAGLIAIERGYFTADEFLGFPAATQDKIMTILYSVSIYSNYWDWQRFDDSLKKELENVTVSSPSPLRP